MPIINVANHFIEANGNPVDPDFKKVQKKQKSDKNKEKK